MNTPQWKHYCPKCKLLGQTIGGKHLVDLYVCDTMRPDTPTLLARYSDEDSDYASIMAGSAHPHGHSELFAAQAIWEKQR